SLADLEGYGATPDQPRSAPPPSADEPNKPDVEERALTAARIATVVRQRCAHRGEPQPPAWRPHPRPPSTDLRPPGAPVDPLDLAGLDLVPAPDPTDPFDLGRCEIPGTGPIPVDMAH